MLLLRNANIIRIKHYDHTDKLYTRSYYPLNSTPHEINPDRGWIATCNNKIAPQNWPYDIPGFYANWRIAMAEKKLTSKPKFDQKDFEEMQMDIVSGTSTKHKKLFWEGAKRLGETELATGIKAWDGAIKANDKVSVVFRYWWHFLNKALYEDELGQQWEDAIHIKEKTIEQSLSYIDNKHTPEKETIYDISAMALKHSLKYADRKNNSSLEIKHLLSNVSTNT